MFIIFRCRILLVLVFVCFSAIVFAQAHYRPIPLPAAISGIGEEYSGMCTYNNRVYLLPQYGDHKTLVKKDNLQGKFLIYSLLTDSIGRVLDNKDSALSAFKALQLINLDKLPENVAAEYEGFEAISIINGTVFLAIESDDQYQNCYLLKGRLDTIKSQIVIDPVNIINLQRPELIYNAGFESVTWLPHKKNLLAYYEYNGRPKGGLGYLIDTSFKIKPKPINVPQLYFRITDITATKEDEIYGINYFWNGDYKYYLDNPELNHQEDKIKKAVPDLADSIGKDPGYLKESRTTYARIIMLHNLKSTKWKQVAVFPGYKDNWEGITLYRKGALVVTDANASKKQNTVLAYIEF